MAISGPQVQEKEFARWYFFLALHRRRSAFLRRVLGPRAHRLVQDCYIAVGSQRASRSLRRLPVREVKHCGACGALEIVITNEKADGFCWGLAAGLLISFSVCCFIHFWVRRCRRADCERPDVGSRSSVTVTIGDHGETSSISSTPGRRRRGGGKWENASARTPDIGLV